MRVACDEMYKDIFMELVEANKTNFFSADQLLKQHGHESARLSSYIREFYAVEIFIRTTQLLSFLCRLCSYKQIRP
jgi:hypothetical protein